MAGVEGFGPVAVHSSLILQGFWRDRSCCLAFNLGHPGLRSQNRQDTESP